MSWRDRAVKINESPSSDWRSRAIVVQEEPINGGVTPIKSFFKQAGAVIDQYNKTQFGSPQDLLNRADALVTKGANAAGDAAAEELARRGINPNVAALIGTAGAVAPDIVRSISPLENVRALDSLKSPARGLARRALGFTKQDLKTVFAQKTADIAAEEALQNKVLPFSGSPKKALQNASELTKSSGESLGAMRENAGTTPLDPIFDTLEKARNEATGGLRGGAWDTVHKKFDEAQETLLSLAQDGAEVSLKQVERVKKLLGKTVNWMADNVSQETAKQVTRAIENGVENVMRSKGLNMAAYEAKKRTFGAAKTMEKMLTKRISADEGNNMVSLPTMIAAGGQLAAGGLGSAASTIGIVEALRRRGSSGLARVLEATVRRGTGDVPISSLQQLLASIANRRRSSN